MSRTQGIFADRLRPRTGFAGAITKTIAASAIALSVLPALAHAQTSAPNAAPIPSAANQAAPAPNSATPNPPPPDDSVPPSASDDSRPAPPAGKVLFSRDSSSPAPAPSDSGSDSPTVIQPGAPPVPEDSLAVTETERTASTFTAYDLDLHLTPASSGLSARAALTLRNDSPVPLRRVVLQISSSLHWDALSSPGLDPRNPARPLRFATHTLDTDADHTGKMTEAVVTLAQPLAPGASLTLTALYSGAVPASFERLDRIGAPAGQAALADWDSAGPGAVALRGFGNVLWYPVAAPPVFLGDGAKLFQAVGEAKLRQAAATIRLRLAVEYLGDPPDAAFFCGRREPLIAISDNAGLPVALSPGIATAVFDPLPLGFRTPDLFLAPYAPSLTGPPANPNLIAAVTDRYDALPAYAAAAALVEPMLADWFGPQPLTSLTLLDHPGQPFEDDALLVRPIHAVDPATLAPDLVHSLTHVWIHSAQPWIDEGLAQFAGLLWMERTAGRASAIAALEDASRALALAEPETPPPLPLDPASTAAPGPAGASLLAPTGDLFYRTKAAAVWWMLRGMVGDAALKQALQTYRADPKLDRDPTGFERILESIAHADLHWFFNDWVYRDRGLPDLSIASVTLRPLESATGASTGWLISVDVRNDGYAAAEVPITVRSGLAPQTSARQAAQNQPQMQAPAGDSSSQTQLLRIPGRSSASIRIVFPGTPTQVEVNDGSIPETSASRHIRQLTLPGR